jgi:hypothetical protein
VRDEDSTEKSTGRRFVERHALEEHLDDGQRGPPRVVADQAFQVAGILLIGRRARDFTIPP